jgi:hypothetical protein
MAPPLSQPNRVDLRDFRQVWLIDFKFGREPGERPTPTRVTARELHTGQELCLDGEELAGPDPPYPVGPESLFVTYDAAGPLGCHLSLGWPLPARVLDLHAEFRCLTAGLVDVDDDSLAAALAYFGWTGDGVEALETLLRALLPSISPDHALLRGRYTAAVAQMEALGIPIDMESLRRLREGWEGIRDELIEQVDRDYGVFSGVKFNPRRWQAWLNRRGIPWPRSTTGKLVLDFDTFRDMAVTYPEVRPMKELRATLALLKGFGLGVGPDGRNRCPLRPFATKTGRNAPSSKQFIFGPATWVRGLIKPAEGMALAYVDYEQQEFGIAAALSGDAAMKDAYASGDPYLAFARQAGAVPPDATKSSHREERERFKHCALGVQYGMGPKSLAFRLRTDVSEARRLLRLHRGTYPRYWQWSDEVERVAFRDGRLQAVFGWTIRVSHEANRRSLRNFPLQANGAEMLRLACIALTEAGVRVCAPVHDALLIEAPVEDVEDAVEACRKQMQRASEQVLNGFPLRTEAKVVRFPDRYMDERGRAMWDVVFGLLDRKEAIRCKEG